MAERVEKKKLQLLKMEIQASVKEDLKTVALGTSKINYLDPRITVAWCKKHEVPMEKVRAHTHTTPQRRLLRQGTRTPPRNACSAGGYI